MVRRAESPLLLSAVLISAVVQCAQAGLRKQHPALDLEAGVDFRPGETRAFTLLTCLTLSLHPSVTRCCTGAVGQKSLPAPAAPLPAVPGHPGIPLQAPQCLSSRQDRHLPLSGPFLPLRSHLPFGKPSSVSDASSLQPCKTRVYVQQHDKWLASQLLLLSRASLSIGGLGMCHFCLLQVLPIFTASPYWWQLESSRLLTGSWRVRVWTVACPSTSHLSAFKISAGFCLWKQHD